MAAMTSNPGRRGMTSRDVVLTSLAALVLTSGALLWMRVIVTCERKSAGGPARCVVVQKRFFGLVPFAAWENEGVKRATHDLIHGTEEAQRDNGYRPTWMLVLDTGSTWQPVESGSQEAVQSAEMQLNRLLLSPRAGTEEAEILTWVPGAFALVWGLLFAAVSANRLWIRWHGGDPDPPPRARKARRSQRSHLG